ncbi:MAG TPA: hypothetical protein DCM28_17390 [Phycisphaerales bacterium]|nr:hypothetical protein [Phycisphaerales bacterium]HCD33192.1 hypothetical protein [Phycisphaerales bacterium]|tara:strand:+ start:406 stop:1158 length:753 start_codon:yes stop_codon:yes gene_type:complete
MKTQRNNAFTLIELLVVISIVSLLIAILLPALTKARKTSRRIACLSNVRQLQVFNQAYCADNKGWYIPPFLNFNRVTWQHDYWTSNSITRQYTGLKPSAPVYKDSAPHNRICPDATYATEHANADGTLNMRYSYGMNFSEYYSYRYTNYYIYFKPDPYLFVGYRDSLIRRPSTVFTFSDARWAAVAMNYSNYYVDENTTTQFLIAYRHDNTVNMVMYDGHAKTNARELVDHTYLTSDEQTKLWYAYDITD